MMALGSHGAPASAVRFCGLPKPGVSVIHYRDPIMTAPTQKHRFASIETPLGEDRLLLRYCNGREELGRLFDYNLTLLDAQQDVNPDDLVGLNVTVRIQLETNELDQARYINGFITSLAFLGYE